MGILLPSLSAARKQAWSLTCQSNLRSIGVASNLFAQDHDHKIPRGGGGAESRRWHYLFFEYLEKNAEGAGYENVKVYNCPAYPDKDQKVCFVINSFDPDPEVLRDTYEFTRLDKLRQRSSTIYLADNQDGSWRPIIQEKSGEKEWGGNDVFAENHLPRYYMEQAGVVGASWSDQREIRYNGSRVAHARHRNGHNALFFDWHVGFVAAEESTVDKWRPKFY
jgi:prepilin-type processing-associated H-X9-DG protein